MLKIHENGIFLFIRLPIIWAQLASTCRLPPLVQTCPAASEHLLQRLQTVRAACGQKSAPGQPAQGVALYFRGHHSQKVCCNSLVQSQSNRSLSLQLLRTSRLCDVLRLVDAVGREEEDQHAGFTRLGSKAFYIQIGSENWPQFEISKSKIQFTRFQSIDFHRQCLAQFLLMQTR